jgi:hypothetical protein
MVRLLTFILLCFKMQIILHQDEHSCICQKHTRNLRSALEMDNCNFKHVDFTCKRIGTGLVVAGYKVMMLDSLLEPT